MEIVWRMVCWRSFVLEKGKSSNIRFLFLLVLYCRPSPVYKKGVGGWVKRLLVEVRRRGEVAAYHVTSGKGASRDPPKLA